MKGYTVMPTFKIDQYNFLSLIHKQTIDQFVCTCFQDNEVRTIHPSELNVTSIQLIMNHHLIGYCGVYQCSMEENHNYIIGIVSCFCIDSKFRKQGYGKLLLNYTERWMIHSNAFDFSIFTCNHKNLMFYIQNSDWCILDIEVKSYLYSSYNSKKLNLFVLFQSFQPQITTDFMTKYFPTISLILPFKIFV